MIAPPQSCPRILVADGHTYYTGTIDRLLSSDFKIVAVVHDAGALFRAVLDLKPDVAVIDVSLPIQDGFITAKRIRRLFPDMIIVFHTLSTDMLLAKQASAIGATTLAADRREPEHLSAAIKAILIGNRGCTPCATRAIETTSPPVLTQRECEVLALLAGGCRMKEVGYRLGISYRTVTFHKYRAMRKMGVQSDADLMRFVFRQNILGNVAAAAVHRI